MIFFPITKKRGLNKGYVWYNRPKSEYKATMQFKDLSDHINETNKSILKQTIKCENKSKNNCSGSGVYRIVPRELEFYKKNNLALPRICHYCRSQERYKLRNPLRLYKRKCQCAGHGDDSKIYKNQSEHSHKGKHCPNKFQTTYAPERKEIVYCEKCYQKEVE